MIDSHIMFQSRILTLNKTLGGGIPNGIYELYGKTGSFRTLFSIILAADAGDSNLSPIYVNVDNKPIEFAIDRSNLDVSKVKLWHPNAIYKLPRYIKDGHTKFIVIDSIPFVKNVSTLMKDMREAMESINNNIIIILVNQYRHSFDSYSTYMSYKDYMFTSYAWYKIRLRRKNKNMVVGYFEKPTDTYDKFSFIIDDGKYIPEKNIIFYSIVEGISRKVGRKLYYGNEIFNIPQCYKNTALLQALSKHLKIKGNEINKRYTKNEQELLNIISQLFNGELDDLNKIRKLLKNKYNII